MSIFIGFGSGTTGPVQMLQDVDLIKHDLLNAFNTRKGERCMDADYGFIGWDLIFELKTAGIKELIEQDARRIINSEPRVTEQSIFVQEEQNGFVVYIELYFDQFETVDTLQLFFDEHRAQDQL